MWLQYAAQLGMKVAIIEKEIVLAERVFAWAVYHPRPCWSQVTSMGTSSELGQHGVMAQGVSLDLAVMMKRKADVVQTLSKGIEALLAKNKVVKIKGTGRLAGEGRVHVTSTDGAVTKSQAQRIILAVGSSVVLPGIECDGNRVGTSTEVYRIQRFLSILWSLVVATLGWSWAVSGVVLVQR